MKDFVLIVALIILAAPASAGQPTPLTFHTVEGEQTQNPVEQQTPGGALQPDPTLWVVNRTGCVWDSDDDRNALATDGYLKPGASATATKCQITDWAGEAHLWSWNVIAPSPRLAVTYRIDDRAVVSGSVLDADGRGYSYRGCLTKEYDHDAVLPPVPDSNGGVGDPDTVTLTVSNPTGRTIRHIGAVLRVRVSLGEPESCPGPTARDGVFPGPFFATATT